MPQFQAYKAHWSTQPPGSQAEEYARDVAVQRVERQLRAEGQTYIDAERERLVKGAETINQSSADIVAAAKAITKACALRIVDVEEVADQLDELEKQARRNRGAIARIEEQQDANEARAEDPVGIAEALYDKYGSVLVSPVAGLYAEHPFRVDQTATTSNGSDGSHPADVERRASKSRIQL